jgi:hypothetical protein
MIPGAKSGCIEVRPVFQLPTSYVEATGRSASAN